MRLSCVCLPTAHPPQHNTLPSLPNTFLSKHLVSCLLLSYLSSFTSFPSHFMLSPAIPSLYLSFPFSLSCCNILFLSFHLSSFPFPQHLAHGHLYAGGFLYRIFGGVNPQPISDPLRVARDATARQQPTAY